MTLNIFGCFNRFTGMNLLKQSSTRGVVVTWSPHFWLAEAQTTKCKGHLKCVFFFSSSIQTCWHGTMFLGSMYWTHTELNSGLPKGKLCARAEKVSPASRLPKYLFLASCYLLCLPPGDTTWCQALSRRFPPAEPQVTEGTQARWKVVGGPDPILTSNFSRPSKTSISILTTAGRYASRK